MRARSVPGYQINQVSSNPVRYYLIKWLNLIPSSKAAMCRSLASGVATVSEPSVLSFGKVEKAAYMIDLSILEQVIAGR